jgi:uncharacterized protein YjiS (DUF1127 family)
MEMHSQRSLNEVHGINAPLRRWSRRGRIARRAITRLLAVLKSMKAAIEAELAARRAIDELAGMNDHMLRDLGITRSEIESTVRRSRANVGTDGRTLLSNDTSQSHPAVPTISSPTLHQKDTPSSICGNCDHGDRCKRASKRIWMDAK